MYWVHHSAVVWSLTHSSRGPLLFCLLLSFFLSFSAREDQKSIVFSGIFTVVWVGESVVTLQIKLLGGNMLVFNHLQLRTYDTANSQLADRFSSQSASSATPSSRSSLPRSSLPSASH
jgi:hypothetical protein